MIIVEKQRQLQFQNYIIFYLIILYINYISRFQLDLQSTCGPTSVPVPELQLHLRQEGQPNEGQERLKEARAVYNKE